MYIYEDGGNDNDDFSEIKGLFDSFVKAISSAIDERTPYNGTHTKHMVEYGGRFIDYLNKKSMEGDKKILFSQEHKEELLMSIWLHDIGKLAIPMEIMNKNARLRPEERTAIRDRMKIIRLQEKIRMMEGKICRERYQMTVRQTETAEKLIEEADGAVYIDDDLAGCLDEVRGRVYYGEDGESKNWLTEEEYEALTVRRGTLSAGEREIMESHVVLTDRLLSEIKFPGNLSHVRQWASSHHEMMDGSGYPRGLKGDEIPYEVRIITILDIFDALIAKDRPYKKGMAVNQANSILTVMAEKEGKLDAPLVRLFIQSRCWLNEEDREITGSA